MKIDRSRISIAQNTLDINLQFYFFLKHLVKCKLSDKQSAQLYQILITAGDWRYALNEYRETLARAKEKQREFDNIIENIENISLFIFALQLYMIKDALLAEANIGYIAKLDDLKKYHQLSLSYDKVSLLAPYTKRVNGALLSLIFFNKVENNDINFLAQASEDYIKSLAEKAKSLKLKGLEPNQIFMLMFSESVNQSITSVSGSNYENRVFNVLTKIGIPAESIRKIHDETDKSTEYDFWFELNGKRFGIGAKKTLRERYKQFIKTALTSDIDVIIEVTLGLDLNEAKAKTIREHGTILFVADEIYQSRDFLCRMEGVYSVNELTLDTLKKLANQGK